MRNAMIMLVLTVALGGCGKADQTARDIGNSADRLADRTDNWGDNASGRIDQASPAVRNSIERANGRLEDVVGRATGTLVTDSWIGRWKGVEGLNLVVARDAASGAGHYTLTMQYSLDDKGVFAGVASGETIRFTRPDGPQVLRATDGMATGLKYLATKKDCLTVKPGEGYCRAK